jgi:hypothetical protein
MEMHYGWICDNGKGGTDEQVPCIVSSGRVPSFYLNIPEDEEKRKSTMETLSVFSAGLQLSHTG